MKPLKTEGISIQDMCVAYHIINKIMESNQLNFNTAWEHVCSALARTIVENAEEIR